ncbi:MAG: hypothetical protein Kow0029_29370 [Candidatus Rifleibacteriota bacterium]
MKYCYDYPRPMATVDAAVLRTPKLSFPEILLIKRGRDPFCGKWALPGGFLEMDESPLNGAARELREETGLTDLPLKPLFACGEPGRDPRGRTLTMVFACLIRDADKAPIGNDDAAEARWFSLKNLPEMAFDHRRVAAQIEKSLIWQAKTSLIGKEVFHGIASMKDLVRLHENICGKACCPELISRAERLGILSCKDGICQYLDVVPAGPDWHPAVW